MNILTASIIQPTFNGKVTAVGKNWTNKMKNAFENSYLCDLTSETNKEIRGRVSVNRNIYSEPMYKIKLSIIDDKPIEKFLDKFKLKHRVELTKNPCYEAYIISLLRDDVYLTRQFEKYI